MIVATLKRTKKLEQVTFDSRALHLNLTLCLCLPSYLYHTPAAARHPGQLLHCDRAH